MNELTYERYPMAILLALQHIFRIANNHLMLVQDVESYEEGDIDIHGIYRHVKIGISESGVRKSVQPRLMRRSVPNLNMRFDAGMIDRGMPMKRE